MEAVPRKTLLSGYKLPIVGLGTMESKPGDMRMAVKTAIGLGYRHFDCAHVYGNEREIGEAIREAIKEGTVKREDVFITTKLWNTYHSKARVLEGCKQSLTKLGLDYIDLYLMHWPFATRETDVLFPKTPDGKAHLIDIDFTETWTAMQDLVDKGMCRSIGVSNFNSKQIQRILDLGLKHPLSCNQIEISPYFSNEKLLQFCKSNGIVVVAYSPLGSADRPCFRNRGIVKDGILPSVWQNLTTNKLLEEPQIVKIASQYNKSPAQVLLRWGIQRGYVVIPKSASAVRQKQNFELFDFELNDDDMEIIHKMNRNFRSCPLNDANHSPYYPFHEEY